MALYNCRSIEVLTRKILSFLRDVNKKIRVDSSCHIRPPLCFNWQASGATRYTLLRTCAHLFKFRTLKIGRNKGYQSEIECPMRHIKTQERDVARIHVLNLFAKWPIQLFLMAVIHCWTKWKQRPLEMWTMWNKSWTQCAHVSHVVLISIFKNKIKWLLHN